MASKGETLLKQSLYLYDLPPEILNTLTQKAGPHSQTLEVQDANAKTNDTSEATSPNVPASYPPGNADSTKAPQGSASCALCGVTFGGAPQQREHVKSDWHGYNMKQRIQGRATVNEPEFERLLETLDESISGSDSSSSDDDGEGGEGRDTKLSALLKKQARLKGDAGEEAQDDDEFANKKRKRSGVTGSPLIWFTSTALPDNTSLGVYRAILTTAEQIQPDTVQVIRKKQIEPMDKKSADGKEGSVSQSDTGAPTDPSIFICMIGGGHFAAMIVSLTPEIVRVSGVPERRAKTIAQKTFHRYTTRRKQGGAQSSNDNAKGPANSAGAAIRRANEAALEQDIRNLLKEWKGMIDGCELLFVRASGTTNRRVLFGQHDGQVLRSTDPRVRTIPFGTRRATQQECMRAFVELTRMKISRVDTEALAAAEAARIQAEEQKAKTPASAASKPKNEPSPEEEEALLHTSQIQALIRRSKVPALLSYLTKNSISPDFRFEPSTSQTNHHASTPLHLAASLNSSLIVAALLVKAGANPSLQNGEGKVAFDIAGDRATRDAFRVARSELGESKWEWSKAHVPNALTKTEADQRDKDERAQEARSEALRRKAELEKLEKEGQKAAESKKPIGRVLGSGIEITAADKREQEARGMTPEMRMKLERERRARAAEERMRKLTGK